MMTAPIDDDSIEEQIENPEPKHLLRLHEGDLIHAQTKSHDVLGYVTEEGELEEWSGGETLINVCIYVPTETGKNQHATLVYYNDPRDEGLVLDSLGWDVDGREELRSLEVICDE
ncbi:MULTISPECIES: hypothetical protein [Halorussus]|uniref:hypothetical protein n=1 Tax=Halorussus TaxID=1070314 RepID=UPI000E216BD7|nr:MULTISPECIES: hypothetical protein [Halorussus]NHN60468.1 hypothetical protein [Halorussus sp. JP-T4]